MCDEGDPIPEYEASAVEPQSEMLNDLLGSSHIRLSNNSNRNAVTRNISRQFPNIQLAPWGGRWSKDVLVLLHNAVLVEIRDLFAICSVLERKQFVLSRQDIRQFYSWYGEFYAFVKACMSVEEEYVFQWITRGEEHGLKAGPMRTGARMFFFGTMRRTLDLIDEYRHQFHPHLPVGERVSGLLLLVDKLSDVPTFYSEAHEVLPDIVEKLHIWTPWKRSSVLRGIVLAMRKQENYQTNLVLLTRWMSESDAKTWIKSMLRNPKDLIQFSKWRQSVLQNHCSFSKAFEPSIDANNSDVAQKPGLNTLGVGMAMEICDRSALESTRVSMLPNGNIEKYATSLPRAESTGDNCRPQAGTDEWSLKSI